MKDFGQYSRFLAPCTPRLEVLRPFWTHLFCRYQFLSHHPHVNQGKQRHDLNQSPNGAQELHNATIALITRIITQ